jgi:cytosine/adenosine deaminase-related metal-dependent hydrolase
VSLIRGKYVICKVLGRHEAVVIEDGAVLQRDGVIVAIGRYDDLEREHGPVAQVYGSNRHVVMPGFVNSHHHVGLTAFQMGAPDMPLELWFSARYRKRDVDPYLDTLYGAFEMIESGITTVQHLHSRAQGPLERLQASANDVIRAYADVGMRVSYSHNVRDQNRIVYEDDQKFLGRLPPDLAGELGAMVGSQTLSVEDNLRLFIQLSEQHRGNDRVRIQLAPANLHWCSDEALLKMKECSDRFGAPLHMHLLETRYQKEYAKRRCGGTAVGHLGRLGLLGPRLTLGHGVWLTEGDIDLIAHSGTHLCHNPSSNLRLRSGIAPLNAFEKKGISVALGLDDCSLNDDRSMLQEMRVALKVHRTPGMDDSVPTACQVLRMATENGAMTTAFGANIGTLEVGKSADMVVMDWEHIAFPYLDDEVPIVDAVVQLARTSGVQTVLIGGEPVLLDGRFTRIDKASAVQALADSLRVPLRPDELRRRELSKKVFPHVRQFYEDEGYLRGEEDFKPFYHFNSRN